MKVQQRSQPLFIFQHSTGQLCTKSGPNVSTIPLRQCLPFSWTTLRGKHCQHPIAVMGVRALSKCQMLERLFLVFPGSINLLCSFSEHAFETQKSRLAQENREKLVLKKKVNGSVCS